MPPGAPATLLHRGQIATLPGKFDHAAATYLLALFDYQAARRLCDGEHFEPIPMTTPPGTRRGAGFLAAVDYHQTDVGPYREWILGLWVTPRGEKVPELRWVNATSLAFYAALAGAKGFTFFAPKMILTQPLPTEVGVEHYGIPKELGQVTYERCRDATRFEVASATGQWILRASVPNSRGFFARLALFPSLVRAFGVGAVLRLAWRKELPITLAGSAHLTAKRALSVVKVDPHAEFLRWEESDCRLAINPAATWGKIVQELEPAPALVCHIPNVAFVLSGPFDQVAGAANAVVGEGASRTG
jgi:hypothetical protein